jgi:lipid II isoglutaminyl synthase (glutamine-hydrolysing)
MSAGRSHDRRSQVGPRRSPARARAAVAAGKLLGAASRRLGRGGGTALPGLVAERLDPRLTLRLALQIGAGRAIVTGTNGKTTTSRMLAGVAREAGLQPVHNRSGSNLMRGIGATLLDAAGVDGRIANGARRGGIFEVDEATLPHAVRALRPSVVVFTNLFRDQLDRYGEVDSISTTWRESLSLLPRGAIAVLNADDPSVAGLADSFAGRTLFYGIDDPAAAATTAEHAADARWCHACGTDYAYDALWYGHLGLWRCPGCGRARPAPQIRATRIEPAGEDHQRVTVVERGLSPLTLDVPLEGLYNAGNALAAYAGARALGIAPEVIARAIGGFSAAFGRQERVVVRGRTLRLLLCKNPAGMNQALGTVLAGDGPLRLLVALNDGVQDGRDISWIWDVDFERLAGRAAFALTTGTRAADMALRLKYAGIAAETEPLPAQAVNRLIAATPHDGEAFILPTYTAMMLLREMVAARGGKRAFWAQ